MKTIETKKADFYGASTWEEEDKGSDFLEEYMNGIEDED